MFSSLILSLLSIDTKRREVLNLDFRMLIIFRKTVWPTQTISDYNLLWISLLRVSMLARATSYAQLLGWLRPQ